MKIDLPNCVNIKDGSISNVNNRANVNFYQNPTKTSNNSIQVSAEETEFFNCQ